jgi:cell division septation protein DedD
VSVVIFLCGVLVGRGVRAERGGVLEALSTPAATPGAVSEAVPAATPSGTPATANEDLSYPSRLARSEPAAESLKPTEAPAPATPPPAPAAPAVQSPAPIAAAPGATPPPAPAAPATAASAAEPAGTGFAIQVAALSKRAEADGVASSLTSKGYPAYVINPDAGAPAVFRVRVGKFKDRREAESVKTRLEKEEQFKPWIVR